MMSPSSSTADLVVGIDFGMTCTGVAYSMAPEWPSPITILHWPGRLGHENRNKVTTAVAYDIRTGFPAAWGFLVNREHEELDVQDLFKLYLDPAYKDAFQNQPPIEEARKWFVDFLSFLHKAIKEHFDEWFPRWKTKTVEYLFSVPTTWKNPAMIAETESLIKRAGFGESVKHVVRISLTEAEAAAVYASKQSYEKDDVLLVCDAGGGTTDVNVLKVSGSTLGQTELKPLTWVEGQAIGSTLIDFKAERMIRARLEQVRSYLQGDPRAIAEKMLSDRFETFKCSFGDEAMSALDLLLPIPGMSTGLDFPQVDIRDSKLVITQQELQAIFDEQIEKIFIFLDEQIQQLQMNHPRETINYMVLSGGFGGSPYLKQRLRKRYELGGIHLPNASGMTILSSREPQLAVVHGIVINRTQELKSYTTVYKERCCPNSYGIVVRQPYNALQHQGEDIVVDPRDKKKWAERQIDWFIKQGQVVSILEGIKHRYRLKLNLGQENTPWRTTLVMSSLSPSQLPKSMRADGVRPICYVESVMNRNDMKLKNRHWYNLGPLYRRAEFELRVLIGAADLKFELWGKDGQMSKSHEEIEVQWNSTAAGTEAIQSNVHESFGMYKF